MATVFISWLRWVSSTNHTIRLIQIPIPGTFAVGRKQTITYETGRKQHKPHKERSDIGSTHKEHKPHKERSDIGSTHGTHNKKRKTESKPRDPYNKTKIECACCNKMISAKLASLKAHHKTHHNANLSLKALRKLYKGKCMENKLWYDEF